MILYKKIASETAIFIKNCKWNSYFYKKLKKYIIIKSNNIYQIIYLMSDSSYISRRKYSITIDLSIDDKK